jgi:hypothetical protein
MSAIHWASTIADFVVEENGGFETPCAGDVADGVTSSSKDNEGPIKGFYEFDTTCVSLT